LDLRKNEKKTDLPSWECKMKKRESLVIDLPVPRDFLHPVSGTLGSDLGAGLFKSK
jgi:hypothetical protein